MQASVESPGATGGVTGTDPGRGRQFVGFRLADQNYVFHIERIQEIVIPTAMARVPEVPAYIEGVTNLRGTIIPIINLRLLFGIAPKPADAETRTVVVNVGARTLGCTVDAVTRVMRIAAEQIHPAPDAVASSGRSFIEGFARIGDELYIVLDVESLLDPAKLELVHRVGMTQFEA
jgi:purine-binding chemotaxis protein CheW